MPSKSQNRSFWLIVGLALIVRVLTLAAQYENLLADPDAYGQNATNLVQSGVLSGATGKLWVIPSAFRPPLYPLVLAAGLKFGLEPLSVWAGLVNLMAGVATVALTMVLARRGGLAPLAPIAGLLVAVDPILLWQSTLVMTETLATLLAVVAWIAICWAAQRKSALSAAVAGASFALAALCRPTFLVALGLSGLVLIWQSPGLLRRVTVGAAYCVAAAVVLAPWGYRNLTHFGRPILTTTHGGYTLHLGNNESYYEWVRNGDWGSVWRGEDTLKLPREVGDPLANDTRLELVRDQRHFELAIETILKEPGTFVLASLLRIGNLWGVLPHRTSADETLAHAALRYAIALGYTALFLLAATGAWSAWKGRAAQDSEGATWQIWRFGLLLALSFTLVHSVYWSNLRMRAPLVPLIALAAAAGTGRLLASRGNQKVL